MPEEYEINIDLNEVGFDILGDLVDQADWFPVSRSSRIDLYRKFKSLVFKAILICKEIDEKSRV